MRGLLAISVAAALAACALDSSVVPTFQARSVEAPDVLYHNGTSVGVEYVNGHEKDANDVLAKECGGTFRILNRSEREVTSVVDAICSR